MVTSSCGVIEAAAAQTPSLELFDKTIIQLLPEVRSRFTSRSLPRSTVFLVVVTP